VATSPTFHARFTPHSPIAYLPGGGEPPREETSMTRRVMPWIGAVAALALAMAGPARAAEPKKAAPPPAPTAEQRQQMADIHQKMADCLRSDRPIAECRKEMATACHDTLGATACPMMGQGAGGMGPGMMGGGKGHGHMMQGQPAPTTPAPPEAPKE
jgi:hypothetical protein